MTKKTKKRLKKIDESIEQNRIIGLLKAQKEKGVTSHVYAKVFVNNITDLNTTDGSVGIDFGVQLWWWGPQYVGHEEGSIFFGIFFSYPFLF